MLRPTVRATMAAASVSVSFGEGYDFDGMERDLQGRSKVVVSKGTLAKVSRQHSSILRQLVLDMSATKSHVKKLQDDWSIVDDLQERVTSLERQLQQAQDTIKRQQETLDKQAEIMEYGKRMEAIMRNIEAVRALGCDRQRWGAAGW